MAVVFPSGVPKGALIFGQAGSQILDLRDKTFEGQTLQLIFDDKGKVLWHRHQEIKNKKILKFIFSLSSFDSTTFGHKRHLNDKLERLQLKTPTNVLFISLNKTLTRCSTLKLGTVPTNYQTIVDKDTHDLIFTNCKQHRKFYSILPQGFQGNWYRENTFLITLIFQLNQQ